MKLHLGCGSVKLAGWINVDLESPVADMHLDLRQPLPFNEGSVEFVFAEHFIEHVERHEAQRLLSDLCRVLKPGGTIRLATPDLRFLAATYLAGNINEWGDLWRPQTPAELMNGGMRYWGHQYLYDAEDLESLLFECGFTRRTYVNWRESSHEDLRQLETRPFHQDLIIEASKPRLGEPVEGFVYTLQSERSWLERLQRQERSYVEQLESEVARLNAELKNSIPPAPKTWLGRLLRG